MVSKKCLELCYRGGAVGGCNGQSGSILQLAACTGGANQRWRWNETDGRLRQRSHDGAECCQPVLHA